MDLIDVRCAPDQPAITKRSEPRSKPLVGVRRRKVLHRGQSPIRLMFLAARVHFWILQTLVFCYGGIRAGEIARSTIYLSPSRRSKQPMHASNLSTASSAALILSLLTLSGVFE